MSEYIDIDEKIVVTDTRGCERETTVRHIFEMNKGVYTAADVAEVVRCKDCIQYVPDSCFCRMADWTTRDEDFCSLAVKRRKADVS